MNTYLLTFPTTTAAFNAEKALKYAGYDASVDAVPFELSKTCYGLGVVFQAESCDDALRRCDNEHINWKRCWSKYQNEYSLEKENH